jgi:ribosomal-protein-alanine N-acetyltransferase
MHDYTLETERFVMTLIHDSDAQDVFTVMNDRQTAEIISFLIWPVTMEQAESWCERSIRGFAEKKEFLFIARSKSDHRPVGCISLHGTNEPNIAEVGYMVTKDCQGQGCATEMLKAIIPFAFRLSRVSFLRATAAFENEVSSHILKKQGFVLIGKRDLPTAKDTILHCHLYEYAQSPVQE